MAFAIAAQTLIPALFFALLAAIFAGLWLLGTARLRSATVPAQRTYLRIAVIFAVVSLWLFYWL